METRKLVLGGVRLRFPYLTADLRLLAARANQCKVLTCSLRTSPNPFGNFG
jgi:hypothetical protein